MFSTITVNYEKWYGNNQATKYFFTIAQPMQADT